MGGALCTNKDAVAPVYSPSGFDTQSKNNYEITNVGFEEPKAKDVDHTGRPNQDGVKPGFPGYWSGGTDGSKGGKSEEEAPAPVQIQSPPSTHPKPTLISYSELQLLEKVGEGTYGEVYRGKWLGKEVAIKRVRASSRPTGAMREEFYKEVAILESIRHPNCVLYMGCCEEPTLCIVTEFISGGTLFHRLKKWREMHNCPLELPLVLKIAKDICLGMLFLHFRKPKVLHRDLKSTNLLCDRYWNTKLADFGISRILNESTQQQPAMTQAVGSPGWMAPELFGDGLYDGKVDVYSYGIVLWELMSLERPYARMGMEPLALIYQVINENLRPKIPEGAHPPLAALVEQCWQADPKKRPGFDDVLARLDAMEADVKAARRKQADRDKKGASGNANNNKNGGEGEEGQEPEYGPFVIDDKEDGDVGDRPAPVKQLPLPPKLPPTPPKQPPTPPKQPPTPPSPAFVERDWPSPPQQPAMLAPAQPPAGPTAPASKPLGIPQNASPGANGPAAGDNVLSPQGSGVKSPVQGASSPTSPVGSPPAAATNLMSSEVSQNRICGVCGQAIFGKLIRASNGRVFHQGCFVCASCSCTLVGGGYMEQGDKHYCTDDFYRLFGKTCGGCGRVIKGTVLTAMGNSFHPECFKCQLCAVQLGERFQVTGGRAVCAMCSSNKRAIEAG
eukprot:jgi/Mesvir1/23652/Mv18316-RA.1